MGTRAFVLLLIVVIAGCEDPGRVGPPPTTPYAFTSRTAYSLDDEFFVTVVSPTTEIDMSDCCGTGTLPFYIDILESGHWLPFSFTFCIISGCPSRIIHLGPDGNFTYRIVLSETLYGDDPTSGTYRLRIPYFEFGQQKEIVTNPFTLK